MMANQQGPSHWSPDGNEPNRVQSGPPQPNAPPSGTYAPAQPPLGSAYTPEQRQQRLNQAIHAELAGGGRIESQTGDTAILVRGGRVNHVLHLILTLVTLGLWSIVWLLLSLTGGEKRRMVSVDDYGNIATRNLGSFPILPAIILGVIVLFWVVYLIGRA